jgi:hypothetical protein
MNATILDYLPKRIATTTPRVAVIAAMACSLQIAAPSARAAEREMIPPSISEPTTCYRLIASSGLEIQVGFAIDVCGGSRDGAATAKCFVEAWSRREDGGLGLTLGQAVDLCRVSGKRQ